MGPAGGTGILPQPSSPLNRPDVEMKHSSTPVARDGSLQVPDQPMNVSGRVASHVLDRHECDDQGRRHEAVRTATDESDEPPPLLRAPGGDEWILLVEDDARLRSLAEQILAVRGYQVLSACDANEALALVDEHHSKLSLLLTDIVLPGANGRQLAKRALRVCPALSVIYMSGYTDEVVIRQGGDTTQAFLAKPFTAVGLLELVRSTLDTARARAKTSGD